MRTAPAVLSSLLLLGGCGGGGGPDLAGPTPIPHGRLVRRPTVDGIEREFLIHVPPQVDGATPVPVVIMIHGTSGSGEKFYNISGWVEKADALGFIAVFPSALAYCLGDDEDFDGVVEPDEFKVTTKWAAGALGTTAMPLCSEEQIARLPPDRRAEIQSRIVRDDVAFFDALVAALRAELPVDPKRMYVTGFSNGAQMSGRLMMERTGSFAAFAMAAGGPSVPGPALRPAPVVFSVGSRDDGFLMRAGLTELPLDDTLVELPAFQGLVGTLTGAVQLDPVLHTFLAQSVNGKMVATHTYAESLVGAPNQLVVAVIEDATHQYPNGTNHAVRTTDLLWPFFSRYSLP
jgi:polyhydroxybutyrate depolymerase